jgi:hypothetical protein
VCWCVEVLGRERLYRSVVGSQESVDGGVLPIVWLSFGGEGF